MKRKQTYISVGLMLYGLILIGQNRSSKPVDSTDTLGVVTVYGQTVKPTLEEKGKKSVTLEEYAVTRNPTNPTETLRFNSPIAYRDFGNGGVSTARFRGTSPTNTAVLWNGVPINSAGNGLTDFNAIALNTTDEVKIVSGGNSTLFGSGAIGGTVLLQDDLKFTNHQNFEIFSQYGSFNTSSSFVKTNFGTSTWGLKVAGAYNTSDNDYEYIDTRFVDEDGNLLFNENGAYYNYNLDVSFGYHFSNKHQLYFYSQIFESDRQFSAGIPNPSAGREQNKDFSQRNLLKWNTNFGKFQQEVKLAYLSLDYEYFNNRFSQNFDFSESQNAFLDYSLKYHLSSKIQFQYLATANFSSIETNLIFQKKRSSIAMVGLLHYQPWRKTTTLLSLRNEENSDFEVPVAVNLGVEQQLGNMVKLKANYSTNYRVPTFNEQFWPRVGNPNLVPEVSQQYELGVQFIQKQFEIQASLFSIAIDDKILWLPSAGSNLWRPRNVKSTTNNGAEITAKAKLKITKNQLLQFHTNYTYTVAKNAANNNTLPFAPAHLWNFNVDYYFNKLQLYFQGLQQSRSFTTEDSNEFLSIDPAEVYNAGVNYTLWQNQQQQLTLGGKVSNINNSVYYFITLRPNPGRNYSFQIHYKF